MKNNKKNNVRREFLIGSCQKLAGLSVTSMLLSFNSCRPRIPLRNKISYSETESPVTRYDFDPSWPKKPQHITFGGIPSMVVDNQDRIWVSSRRYPAMQVYDTNGNLINSWDRPDMFSESSTNPKLFLNRETIPNLHYFRFDNEGNIWVANTNRHIVQKCDVDGNVLMTIGTADRPGEDTTHLSRPTDMTITPAGIFISDGYGNRRIVHFSKEGKFIKTWGREGVGPGEFIEPHAIVHDSHGHLYVSDRGNIRIQVFDFDGNLLDIWRDLILPFPLLMTENDEIWTCGTSPVKLEHYSDITGGRLQQDQLIMRFNTDGKILQIWAFPTCARNEVVPGSLNMAHCIALDSRGDVYIGEAFNPGPKKFLRSTELSVKVEGEYL